MENTTRKKHKLDYHGNGKDYFGIIIINWLLTIVTLGFYYPWAKAKQLNFLYGSTSLNNDRFQFHGTGKEMFIGFIKAILVFAIIYGLSIMFIYMQMPITGILLLYAGILGIIPLAIIYIYKILNPP